MRREKKGGGGAEGYSFRLKWEGVHLKDLKKEGGGGWRRNEKQGKWRKDVKRDGKRKKGGGGILK